METTMCGPIGATQAGVPAGGCGGGATTQSTTQGGGDASATGAAAEAMAGQAALGTQSPHQHDEAGHSKTIHQRTAPVDRDLAKKNLGAVIDMFGNLTRDQLTFDKVGGTHGKLSAAQKAAFHEKYPDLPVPNAVVFDAKGGKPIGVVYGGKTPPELGMGTSHTHGTSTHYMQHIWFTPNDLDFAFSDTVDGATKKANQIVNG
jgi:hypothetical protein